MKIAHITANFGGIDPRHEDVDQHFGPPKFQKVEYHRHYITEANSPVPLPNLSPKMKAKYFKLQAHQIWLFKEYDFIIWTDASIQITSPFFAEAILKPLIERHAYISIDKHPDQNCIYDEITTIEQRMAQGNEYLRSRYANQPIRAEVEHYRNQLGVPPKFGLYTCGIFAYKTFFSAPALNNWWALVCQWSDFDQTAFTAAIFPIALYDKYNIGNPNLGDFRNNPFFKHHPHNF